MKGNTIEEEEEEEVFSFHREFFYFLRNNLSFALVSNLLEILKVNSTKTSNLICRQISHPI